MAANSQINLALRIQADMKQAINQTQAFSAELEGAGDSSGRAGQQLQEFAHSGTQAEEALGRATTQLKHMVAGFVSLAALRGAVNIADDYVTMADRIELATSSTAEYEMVQRRLLDTANNTYRALSEAQEVYIQSSIGLRDMGYSASESLDIVDSLSYSFVRNATSTDKAGSALNALTRAVNRGSVLTDHWATLLLAVPTILEDIAAVSGMTTQEISKLGYEGKLSAELLTEGLRLSLDENKAAAADMYTTVADAVTSLQNALSVYLGEANRATSATSLIAKSIELLAKNLDTVANVALVGLSAATTRYVVNLGLATKAAISSTLATRAQAASELQLAQAQAASALAAANAARAQAGLTISHAQAKVAVDAHAAAQARLTAVQGAGRGVAALLGGPVGLVTLAAAAAASFLLFRDSAVEVRSSLNDLSEPLSSAMQRFNELTKVEQASELDKLNREIKAIEETTTNLGRTLANTVNDEIVGAFGLFGKATGDVKDTLELVHKASGDAVRGVAVDWDTVALAIRNTAGMSDEMRSKLLDMIAELVKSGRYASELSARHLELANSSNEAASGIDNLNASLRTGSAEGDAYLKRLRRQVEDLKDASHVGRASRDIRDTPELHNLSKEQLDEIFALSQELDKLDAARRRGSASSRESSITLAQVNEQLARESELLGMLGPQREAAQQLERIEQNLKRGNIALSEPQRAALMAQIQAMQELRSVTREMDAVYSRANAASQNYNRTVQAAQRLVQMGAITQEQYNRELVRAGAAYESASNPAQRLTDSIKEQMRLMTLSRREREIEMQMIQATNQLLREGIDLRQDEALATQLRAQYEQSQAMADTMREQDSIQGMYEALKKLGGAEWQAAIYAQELAQVWDETATRLVRLEARAFALSEAFEQGGITAEYFRTQMALLNAEAAAALNELGYGDSFTIGMEALGQLLEGYKSVASSLAAMTGDALVSWSDGLADSLARAVVSGDNLRESLHGVANQILTEMISALIKLGIQYAMTHAMVSGSMQDGITSRLAMGAAQSMSWSPAASFAGMFGGMFADGGHVRGPGTGTSDSIPAWLSDYEFVTRAAVVEQPGALPFLHDFNQRGMQALHDWSRRIARHSTGGLAGIPAPAFPAPALGISNIQEPAKNMSTTLNNKIALNLIDSPERIAEALNTPAGTEALTVMLSNDPAKFRQILGVN